MRIIRSGQRRTAAAAALLFVAGLAVPASAAHPAVGTAKPDKVEVWRLHPTAAAARQAEFTITVNVIDSGNRAALLLAEDRRVPSDMFDDGVSIAYAELANGEIRPQAYDHEHGIDVTNCDEPVVGKCSDYGGARPRGDSVSWTYDKPIINGKPDPNFRFHDIYVGAVNAHITGVRLTGPAWTTSRATNATMVLIQNEDTQRGAGAQTANYTVEHFNGVQLAVPKKAWAAVHVQLPCEPGLLVPQEDARLSGYTFPQDGRSYIPLSCRGSDGDDVVATAGRTVRLTMTSTAPMTVDDWSASQTVNRLVALIVTDRNPPTHH